MEPVKMPIPWNAVVLKLATSLNWKLYICCSYKAYNNQRKYSLFNQYFTYFRIFDVEILLLLAHDPEASDLKVK